MKTGKVYRGYGVRFDTTDHHGGRWNLSHFSADELHARGAIERAAHDPFVGVTTDGEPVPGLYTLQDDGLAVEAVKAAAEAYLQALPEDRRAAAVEPLNSYKRRLWANGWPFYEPHGLLLELQSQEVRDRAADLLQATFSARGFTEARTVMKLNALLGELIGDEGRNLTEWMYWLTLFDRPSLSEPWGWQLMGHHLDINVYICGGQMVVTPAFMGAEPRISDEADGPYAGLRAFDDEETGGLAMMTALRPDQQKQAALYPSVLSKDLPPALAGRGDGRHRAGAGQDNLVLPYEGLRAADMTEAQRLQLLELVDVYVARMPEGPRQAKMAEVRAQLDETYFAWIGDLSDPNAAFYYRIHSPVVLIEFDQHMGVFLDNAEPERFHSHTILRTPNGGDYGIDLLRQHYEQFEHTPDGRHIPRRPKDETGG